MRLIKGQNIKIDYQSIFDAFKDPSDDPAWVYGDKLFYDYLQNNNPQLLEWMTRIDIICVACEYEKDNGPDSMNLGCNYCWTNECDMLDLSNKFYEDAKLTVHLLTCEQIEELKKRYIQNMEIENETK